MIEQPVVISGNAAFNRAFVRAMGWKPISRMPGARGRKRALKRGLVVI